MNKYSNLMVNSVGNRFNSSTSYRSSTTGSEAFFIDKPKDKTDGIKNHQAEIFAVYDDMVREDKIMIIPDFTINILSHQSPKILPEIDEKNKEPSIIEMAIIHLKSYPNAYKKYEQIIELQRELENDSKKVTEFIREEIKSILQLEDNTKIDELVYFYQNKIQDYRGYQKDFDYKKEDFESTYNFMAKELKVPLPEKNELIKQHIISIYQQVIVKLCNLNDDTSRLSILNNEFTQSLQSVIATKPLGLQGKCMIEEKLSLSYKFKQFVKRNKMSLN